MAVFKKKRKIGAVKFVTSINDITVRNWENFHATGDGRYLYLDTTDKRVPSNALVQDAYFNLHDQYTEITGKDNKLTEWRTLIIMYIEAIEAYMAGDKSQINWVDYYDKQITELMKRDGESDMVESRLIYSQAFGQPINADIVNLGEFVRIIKIVKLQNKPKTKENGK